jgi:hypothetical protein
MFRIPKSENRSLTILDPIFLIGFFWLIPLQILRPHIQNGTVTIPFVEQSMNEVGELRVVELGYPLSLQHSQTSVLHAVDVYYPIRVVGYVMAHSKRGVEHF